MFAPRPSEAHDTGTLSATVLSPTVEASSPPAVIRTLADPLPLAVLAAALLVLVAASPRRRTLVDPVHRFDPAAPRGRPPRRGPPTPLV
ncbi:MAG: hypothetical protein JWN67_1318 [Actinomycetia bacterium]|nr:hypothetical protein [Actinomycetes bacterium]